ncbi:histidine kinase [Microbacterium sp. AZCO]|uniref:sensor histidine kinase n=1 Tax=Microbacterium sp. AZCO TaxID=3142976 RepID=UPI0031F3C9A2
MSVSDSRGSDLPVEPELRLPRPPGVLRRYWARHSMVADALIAALTAVLSLAPLGVQESSDGTNALAATALVLSLIGCAGLLVRRRFPVAVFAIAALAQTASLLTEDSSVLLLIGVAGFALSRYATPRAAWIAFGAACAVWGAVALVVTLTTPGTRAVLIAGAAASIGFALIGMLIGLNARSRRRYLDALIDLSRRLAVERDQRAQLAVADERARIARELHDIVAHSLTVMVTLAEGISASVDADRIREGSRAISATGRDALRDMRATLGVLRSTDDEAPLHPTVRDTTAETVDAARTAGFAVTLTTSGDPAGIDSAVTLAVSRIVQEAVTNVMRHASGASRIDAAIDYGRDAIEIRVQDDGVAQGAPNGGGFGLRGLRERAELLGGTCEAGPVRPRGWEVRAIIPRPERNRE